MDFNVNLKQIQREYNITLHKVNKEILGEIPIEFIDSLTRSIDGTDEIQFTIPKFITNRFSFQKIINPLYYEVSNERFICVDNKEYFVIKEIKEDGYKNKVIRATSAEVKLGKINLNIEDMGLQLFTEDKDAGIISLNNYMKEETGWTLGNVDDSIGYETTDTGEKREKVRWQESVDSNWHDFLINDIKEEFGCVVQFDTYNKKVHLYDVDSFGDNIELVLSYDNYIKSHEKTRNSDEIVTRMTLVGNEEMDIVGATVTGYKYIENYSYFLENGEMSKDLVTAILKYNEMIKLREVEWLKLIDEKNKKNKELRDNKNKLQVIYSTINALYSIKKTYETNKDTINAAKVASDITKNNDEKVILEVTIKNLEQQVLELEDSIKQINILCKRETATDENGQLIFNEILLEELKEFIYCDTYTNDSFLKVEDLIETGKRELELKCRPTIDWTIDSVNFLSRIINMEFRQHWNGSLSVGDIIIFYDRAEGTEDIIYFVGYTQNFKDGSLNLDLSNKKLKEDNTRTISDYLTKSKHTMDSVNKKKYLLNRQKFNRMNVPESVVF
ncbi:phage tail protein [Clostridioides difficile]|nr:phage tail protein [Clostridioides difficile]